MFLLRKTIKNVPQVLARNIFTNAAQFRDVTDRKKMLKSLPTIDEGTGGEKGITIDSLIQTNQGIFPTSKTMNQIFNGVLFKDLPIINIRVSHNNSIFTYTDSKGTPKLTGSCGVEGFKNARKGTNIAAQTTGVSFGSKVAERGTKTVKVRVRGLGSGRISAIKGLQMAGLTIVSITDNTRVTWTPLRSRKQRKL